MHSIEKLLRSLKFTTLPGGAAAITVIVLAEVFSIAIVMQKMTTLILVNAKSLKTVLKALSEQSIVIKVLVKQFL